MKAVILYHPKSEFSRQVEEYVRDFERQKGKSLELISLETKEGADMAKLYDIVQYPAVLALKESGELLKDWQGSVLPLMNEVAGYLEA